jgi:hypothetical protein
MLSRQKQMMRWMALSCAVGWSKMRGLEMDLPLSSGLNLDRAEGSAEFLAPSQRSRPEAASDLVPVTASIHTQMAQMRIKATTITTHPIPAS